jgi:hypothetical protein
MKFFSTTTAFFALATATTTTTLVGGEPVEQVSFIGTLEITSVDGSPIELTETERVALIASIQDTYNNLDTATIDRITNVELTSTTITTSTGDAAGRRRRRQLLRSSNNNDNDNDAPSRNLSTVHSSATLKFAITTEECTFCHQDCTADTESLACVKKLTEEAESSIFGDGDDGTTRKLTSSRRLSWDRYGNYVCSPYTAYSCSWSSSYYDKPSKM